MKVRDIVTGLIVDYVCSDGPNRFIAKFPDGEHGSELRHHWQPINATGDAIDWPDSRDLAA